MKANLYRYVFALMGLSLLAARTPLAAAERAKRTETQAQESPSDRSGSQDYVLQPQDVLKVFVFQHDDLNKQTEAVSISQEYTVSLPLVGTLNLKGKTVRQAEAMIREAYDKDYLVKPQVSVIVVKYSDRSVNVIGNVTNAGRVQFPLERGLTIIEAIALAGGQTRLADLKKVKLTRKKENGDTEVQEIDVDALMKRGGRDAFPLQKDDVIFVPERII